MLVITRDVQWLNPVLLWPFQWQTVTNYSESKWRFPKSWDYPRIIHLMLYVWIFHEINPRAIPVNYPMIISIKLMN